MVEDGLDGAFTIERVTLTWFDPRPGDRPDTARPALAFWMIRQSEAQRG